MELPQPRLCCILPGLTLKAPVELGRYLLVPLGTLDQQGVSARDLETAHEICGLYTRLRGASQEGQAVLVQVAGEENVAVGIATCDFLALSAATKAYQLVLSDRNALATDPLYFFRSPIFRNGEGYSSSSSRVAQYWGSVDNFNPPWPIEERLPSVFFDYDHVLCRQLCLLQEVLGAKERDSQALLMLRCIELATVSLEGFSWPAVGMAAPTRRLTLLVSAFEVLARTWGHSRVDLDLVRGLAEQLRFETRGLEQVSVPFRRKGEDRLTTVCGRVLCDLYRFRNELAHGEPEREGCWHYKSLSTGAPLIPLAVLVLRALLRNRLDCMFGSPLRFSDASDEGTRRYIRDNAASDKSFETHLGNLVEPAARPEDDPRGGPEEVERA